MIIADVRSHGYYDAGAHRIHGSIRIEPNNLEERWISCRATSTFICTVLDSAKPPAPVWRIYSENEVSNAFRDCGGLRLAEAGYPVEQPPQDDLVKLPTFA